MVATSPPAHHRARLVELVDRHQQVGVGGLNVNCDSPARAGVSTVASCPSVAAASTRPAVCAGLPFGGVAARVSAAAVASVPSFPTRPTAAANRGQRQLTKVACPGAPRLRAREREYLSAGAERQVDVPSVVSPLPIARIGAVAAIAARTMAVMPVRAVVPVVAARAVAVDCGVARHLANASIILPRLGTPPAA